MLFAGMPLHRGYVFRVATWQVVWTVCQKSRRKIGAALYVGRQFNRLLGCMPFDRHNANPGRLGRVLLYIERIHVDEDCFRELILRWALGLQKERREM